MENRADDTNTQFADHMDQADYLEQEAIDLQARFVQHFSHMNIR